MFRCIPLAMTPKRFRWQALQAMGKVEEALTQFEKSIRVEKKAPNKGKNVWKGYLKIAELFKSLSDFSQSLSAYDMAYKHNPAQVTQLNATYK